jgi:PKD repeat protein
MIRVRNLKTDRADSEMIGSLLLISLIAVAVAIVFLVLIFQPISGKIPEITPNITMYTSTPGQTYIHITHVGGDPLGESSSTVWNSDGTVDPSEIRLIRSDGSEVPWKGDTWAVGTALLVPAGSADPGTVGVVYKDGSGQHLLFRQGAGMEQKNALEASFTYSPKPVIVGQAVQFTDITTGGPTSWSWSFGDVGTSNVKNPSHTYLSAGTYTVLLTASNAEGMDSVSQTIVVYSVPPHLQVSFTGVPDSGMAPLSVQFTDTSSGTPTSWYWDFGDGSTSSLQNPLHSFQNSGTYQVKLTAANAYGSGAATQTITVAVCPHPQASFLAAPISGNAPLTVQFTDASTGSPTSWLWDFGDGGTGVTRNATHIFSNQGSFVVSLTVSNSCGQATASQTIIVTSCPVPQASFTADKNSGPVPLTVQFTDISTGSPTSWSWNFGDGVTSTTRNPSHTFTSAGTYYVTLTVSSACGSSTSDSYVVTPCQAPTATFAVDINTGPVPLTVHFSDTSTGSPTAWSWNFGDGITSGERNPAHIFTLEGSYQVNMSASNSCGQTSTSQIISVTACPIPQSSFSFTPSTGAAPLPIQFTDTSTGPLTRWSWDFGDNTPVSSLQNPSHTFTNPINYLVSLTVFNACGQNTSSRTVEVHPSIVAAFDYSPITGNAPLNVQFIDRSTGSPTMWSWNFGDNSPLSALQNPSHTFTTPGTYIVHLTAGNSYSSGTVSHTVTVVVPPTPTPTPTHTGGNVYLNTEKVGYIEQGGYMQFRVTGGNPSYIKIANTRIEFHNGDTVKLVVGSDGSGNVYMRSGMISTFKFNGVGMYINGVLVSTGNVNEIYVGNHDSYVSTMTITTSSQTKWTDLKINGNQIIRGESSATIRVFNIAPDSSGVLNLDTLSPGSSKVYFVGSASSVTY